MTTYNYMIHRFETATIFGDSEEYEEFTSLASMQRRLKWLDAQDDGYEYWAEGNDGTVYEANGCESRHYTQDEPDHASQSHTAQCHEYWDRGLECQCIPEGVKQAILDGANPEDVM